MKIDLYNFEQYSVKVGAFFSETQCILLDTSLIYSVWTFSLSCTVAYIVQRPAKHRYTIVLVSRSTVDTS